MYGAPGPGVGRPNTTLRDVGRDGFFFLGLGWDLSGVEGGRKVRSSSSSSEESSSEVKMKERHFVSQQDWGHGLVHPSLVHSIVSPFLEHNQSHQSLMGMVEDPLMKRRKRKWLGR